MSTSVVICATWIVAVTNLAQASPVGQKKLEWTDASRNRKITASLWYPAQASAVPSPQDKGIFEPVVAAPDAPLEPSLKNARVVVLSHGSGGLGSRLFWLGGFLASKGYVVLALNHPGNRLGDQTPEGLLKVWERARDLTFALDRLEALEFLKGRIELHDVVAIGHSAGGGAVLMLAGARLWAARLTSPLPQCKSADPYVVAYCQKVKALDPHRFPARTVEADYTDVRVTKAIGLDPGFSRSFDPVSLGRAGAKMYVFGADHLSEPADDVESGQFGELLPSGHFEKISGATHMTFNQACKPGVDTSKDAELAALCAGNEAKLRAQEAVRLKVLKLLN